jgi:hypothetical protein
MDGDAPTDVLDWLTQRPPAEIEAWLNENALPTGFNWRLLAQVASMEALSPDSMDPAVALAWGRVAWLSYDRLAANASSESEHDRYVCDAMRMRTELINRLGASPGDPLLDCDQIFEWFLTRRASEFAAVVRDANRWRELPVERIRQLRSIKHEVAVLRMLSQCAPAADTEVQRWIQLWDQLP